MWRSIGPVTLLALFLAGCGGGDSGGGGSLTTYSIGGTVTGLTNPGLVLQTNAGDLVTVSKAGAFTFANHLAGGAAYRVFVKTQPSSPPQNCVVTNGTGFVGTANVTTVAVACSTVTNYTVEGTVSGLVGSGLTLEICPNIGRGRGGGGYGTHPPPPPCHSPLQVSANGAFTLDAVYPAGYSGGELVVVSQEPSSPTQRCLVGNPSIDIQNGKDTGVTVSCGEYNEYSYVTNAADNTLSSYRVDATTGALTVVGMPIATGASPSAMVAVDYGYYGNRFVYVGNEGSNDVSAFAVNSATGALTAVPGSPFAAGTDPKAMTFDGRSNLYGANAGSDTLSAYAIDPNTGALTPLSPATIATGKGPTSIVVGPDGSVIYVANHGGSNDISAFYSGLIPVPGSPFPAGGNPLSLALGAGGKLLYSANPDATHPSISGFSIDPATGALSPLNGSPFPLPVSHYMAIEQTGIQAGSLSSPTSGYLYVTTDASIVGYAFDWTTGALTALPGFPVAAGANANSVNIVGDQFLYVANDGAANISGFTLDLLTGALTPMAGSPFPAGNHPQFIAMF